MHTEKFMVLAYLWECEDYIGLPVDLVSIHKAVKRKKQPVKQHLYELISEGLVKSGPDLTTGKGRFYGLTEKAHAFFRSEEWQKQHKRDYNTIRSPVVESDMYADKGDYRIEYTAQQEEVG